MRRERCPVELDAELQAALVVGHAREQPTSLDAARCDGERRPAGIAGGKETARGAQCVGHPAGRVTRKHVVSGQLEASARQRQLQPRRCVARAQPVMHLRIRLEATSRTRQVEEARVLLRGSSALHACHLARHDAIIARLLKAVRATCGAGKGAQRMGSRRTVAAHLLEVAELEQPFLQNNHVGGACDSMVADALCELANP